MLLKEFPDLAWLKARADQRFSDRRGLNGTVLEEQGWPTVLLNARTKKELRDDIRGPLSIFTNLTGSSTVSAGRSKAKVTPDVFFVSNADQRYTLEIAEPVETFNIHVGEKLAESVLYTEAHKESFLLDYPAEQPAFTPAFHNRLYWRTPAFDQLVGNLQQARTKLEEQELLAELVRLLLADHLRLQRGERALTGSKGTREEIMRRLLQAVDYLYTFFQTEVSLDAMAKAGCLSKFHFLRLYKQVFNETPHQTLVRLRIENQKTI